jgi:hypothetical protein
VLDRHPLDGHPFGSRLPHPEVAHAHLLASRRQPIGRIQTVECGTHVGQQEGGLIFARLVRQIGGLDPAGQAVLHPNLPATPTPARTI